LGRPPTKEKKKLTDHIPTIAELVGRPERELTAIFRKATAVATDATQPRGARQAAAKTVENVRRCLNRPPAP